MGLPALGGLAGPRLVRLPVLLHRLVRRPGDEPELSESLAFMASLHSADNKMGGQQKGKDLLRGICQF